MAEQALEVDYFQENVQRLSARRTGKVARASGISRTEFSYIINGHCRPRLDTALCISYALNCPLDCLLMKPKKLIALERKMQKRDRDWESWDDGADIDGLV